ncbi:MAG: serine/threonine-protein kinase [Pseudomonadota bacterium]
MKESDDTLRELLKDPKEVSSIGRYEILGMLGRGNMGEVLRARDPMIGRMVALKTRRFDLIYDKRDLDFVINKFFEEARIAGNLLHPNIVTIYDVGQDGDHCYIAMELLEGQTLTAFNKKETLLPQDRVFDIVKRICYALDFAHAHNVIHRDIKPANLMLSGDGNIKITDFGIALTTRAENTAGLEVMGTPSYMSPEQTKGNKLTRHTDFFSVGVVLFELLVGRRPFRGYTLYELMDNIRYTPPPSIIKIDSRLPPGIDLVIQKALEKEPDLRYQSGAEFADEIDQAVKGKRLPLHDMKASKKADLLKSVDFFRPFNRLEVEEITRFGKFIRYDKSQVIVREGDIDTTFFVLLSGKVKVVKNKRKVAEILAGSCFGEMGAYTKSARTAHVIAREPSLVVKLDLKVIERESPDLRIKFYQVFMETLIDRLEKTTKLLSEEKRTRDKKSAPPAVQATREEE